MEIFVEGQLNNQPIIHIMPACSKLLAAILPIVAIAVSAKNSNKPPAFFLAGDSTTAIDGGWGDGFLGTLKSPAWGINTGQSGATTLSYQQGGNWTNVTAHVEEYAKEFDTYVTISVSKGNSLDGV